MSAPAWFPPVLSGVEVEPPIRAVLRELNKPTEIRVEQMPLNGFVEYLTKRYKIQFKLDRAALRRLGISEVVPFSVTAVGLPLKHALERNLRPLGLRTRVADGVVLITLDQTVERIQVLAQPVQPKLLAALQAEDRYQSRDHVAPKVRRVPHFEIPYPLQARSERITTGRRAPKHSVSAQLEGITLDQALRQILGRFRLTYRVVGGHILITNDTVQPERPRVIGERLGLPMRPVLRPGFVAGRMIGRAVPQLAVMLKPLIEAEVLFVKKVCTPSKEELGQIRRGVEAYIDTTNPGAVSSASSFVRESVDELVEKHLSRAKADLYRAECRKRTAYERTACVHTLVAQLDRELCLSTAQRGNLKVAGRKMGRLVGRARRAGRGGRDTAPPADSRRPD